MGFPAKFFLFHGVFGGFFRLLFGPGTHPLDLLGALLVPAGQARVVRHLHAAGKAPVQAVPPGQLVPLQDALPASFPLPWQRGHWASVYQLLLPFFSQISSGVRSSPHTGHRATLMAGSTRQVDGST